ncbi:MAG: Gfo/Idh/MocA family oxidoreductase [Bacteroidetes bacterium]|nr:Gfo/Idh/MocA family oxidoreductase [Bacteroidota bacterium]
MSNQNNMNRRHFVKNSLKASAATTLGLVGFPTIVPASVFGKNAPSNKINIGAIGVGRISRDHDMFETLQYDHARIMAVCDLDSKRLLDGKKYVNDFYTKKTGKEYDGVTMYDDHKALLQNKDIDAVLISTPDHSHAYLGIHAVEAGKDVYLQKPASLTIAEGRALSNAVHRTGRILQIGSQQRSSVQFRYAAELVRNGRIGTLKTVYVGLPGDPGGEQEPEMPIPKNLNYDAWLGSTPNVYYTEKRVHPQNDYGRPGWLRMEQFGAGMITGWGAHHVDCAHWGMDTEYTGPLEISGHADFPKSGLWNVHGLFQTEGIYANGVKMIISNEIPNGIKFVGTEGWIFVTRGDYRASSSDPIPTNTAKALSASNDKIIQSVIGENEINLYRSTEQHGNWLDCIKSRVQPISPVEIGHRSCSTCLLHHIAMKLNRKIYWDPMNERFMNDDEANALLNRPHRFPYEIKGLD